MWGDKKRWYNLANRETEASSDQVSSNWDWIQEPGYTNSRPCSSKSDSWVCGESGVEDRLTRSGFLKEQLIVLGPVGVSS